MHNVKNIDLINDYEMSSKYYSDKISNIIYCNKYIIQPYFQRNFVWDNEKSSALIESILLKMQIPIIYTYTKSFDNNEIVIDGQQRITSIRNFLNNKFKLEKLSIYKPLNGLFYNELSNNLKDRILNYSLEFKKIENIDNEDVIFEIFKRFNTGGIALNNQEIRRCIYSSPYTDLITELTNYYEFAKLFKNCTTNRMEKEEYILRFFALYQDLNNYNGNMKDFLDNYLDKKMKNNNIEEIRKLRKLFMDTIDACIIVFGDDAFKNCLTLQTLSGKKNVMYKLMSKSVYDLQMLGFADIKLELINRHAKEIKSKYEEIVLNDEKIRPYYKKMSKRAVEYRVSKWRELIKDIIKY